MSEKLMAGALAITAALGGGAINSILEARETKGELRAIQAAVVRIEQRLDNMVAAPKPKDRN